MVSGKAISPLTKAVLGTALYYKARWAKKFDEPKPGPFDQLDGEKLDVQMMAGRFSHLIPFANNKTTKHLAAV